MKAMSKPAKKPTVNATAGKKRDRQLPARVNESLWALLEAEARKERRKVAPMVVLLLEEALRARGRIVPPPEGDE